MAKKTGELEPATRRRRSIGRPSQAGESVGRDAIIRTTCNLLREMPPNKVTRALVAEHANVDPSLIRYYFRDRATLLVAAAERISTEYSDMAEEAVARSDQSPMGKLLARIDCLVDLEAAYPYFHRLILEEVNASAVPEAKRLMAYISKRGKVVYDACLAAGLAEGSFRPIDGALLFLAILGMCEQVMAGRTLMEIWLGRPLAPKTFIAEYKKFICDMVAAAVADPAAQRGGKGKPLF